MFYSLPVNAEIRNQGIFKKFNGSAMRKQLIFLSDFYLSVEYLSTPWDFQCKTLSICIFQVFNYQGIFFYGVSL